MSVDVHKLALGLYRFYWLSGGSSLVSVGMMADGKRWVAPTNWVAPVMPWGESDFASVREAVRIDVPDEARVMKPIEDAALRHIKARVKEEESDDRAHFHCGYQDGECDGGPDGHPCVGALCGYEARDQAIRQRERAEDTNRRRR